MEKYNEIQLTENKMNLNRKKWKIIHPRPVTRIIMLHFLLKQFLLDL